MAHPKISDKSTTANPPTLPDQVRDKLLVKYYNIRTQTQIKGAFALKN